jgi:hypothetical protein
MYEKVSARTYRKKARERSVSKQNALTVRPQWRNAKKDNPAKALRISPVAPAN